MNEYLWIGFVVVVALILAFCLINERDRVEYLYWWVAMLVVFVVFVFIVFTSLANRPAQTPSLVSSCYVTAQTLTTMYSAPDGVALGAIPDGISVPAYLQSVRYDRIGVDEASGAVFGIWLFVYYDGRAGWINTNNGINTGQCYGLPALNLKGQ
jgi:hypothetical protein